MSYQGVERAARALAELQNATHELIAMGSEAPSTASGKQDILLGKMLQKASEGISPEFARLTLKTPPSKPLSPLQF
jgi:hypothetical protein